MRKTRSKFLWYLASHSTCLFFEWLSEVERWYLTNFKGQKLPKQCNLEYWYGTLCNKGKVAVIEQLSFVKFISKRTYKLICEYNLVRIKVSNQYCKFYDIYLKKLMCQILNIMKKIIIMVIYSIQQLALIIIIIIIFERKAASTQHHVEYKICLQKK